MSQGKGRTYEWYVGHHYNNYLRLKQYRDALALKTITLEDLMNKARGRALRSVSEDQLIANRQVVDQDADLRADADYREQRIDEYERTYGEWDDAADKALLISLVELEAQQRAILRDLSRASTLSDKDKYWTALRYNTTAQKELQVTLGVDKKSRDQARISGNPMDNWKEIKDEIGDWVDMLTAEFVKEVSEVKDLGELRDIMKYKLSWPLDVIDAVLDNHKRVLSLEDSA